jgi:hypothetical protein
LKHTQQNYFKPKFKFLVKLNGKTIVELNQKELNQFKKDSKYKIVNIMPSVKAGYKIVNVKEV